jgi:hypothetical protein
VGILKVGTPKVGTPKVGILKVGTPKVGTPIFLKTILNAFVFTTEDYVIIPTVPDFYSHHFLLLLGCGWQVMVATFKGLRKSAC